MTRSLPLPVVGQMLRPSASARRPAEPGLLQGRARPPEDDDPMELVGVALAEGDVDEMAETLVDEFVRLGMRERELLQLFRHPHYRMTHALYRARGEAWAKGVIERVLARWGESHG